MFGRGSSGGAVCRHIARGQGNKKAPVQGAVCKLCLRFGQFVNLGKVDFRQYVKQSAFVVFRHTFVAEHV
ncbi:hypothetical protein FACS1894133_6720 [Clostridia bacterium]|nr:hypothetical protein FACS1894133_6720 [Clostridia bacterium]